MGLRHAGNCPGLLAQGITSGMPAILSAGCSLAWLIRLGPPVAFHLCLISSKSTALHHSAQAKKAVQLAVIANSEYTRSIAIFRVSSTSLCLLRVINANASPVGGTRSLPAVDLSRAGRDLPMDYHDLTDPPQTGRYRRPWTDWGCQLSSGSLPLSSCSKPEHVLHCVTRCGDSCLDIMERAK